MKALAAALCLFAHFAVADPLVPAEVNAIAICVAQDMDHAARTEALSSVGWFALVPGNRAEAVAALAAAQAPMPIMADPALTLAAAHEQRVATLTRLSNTPDDAGGSASWFEGGSVTGRSFLLLETLPQEVTCGMALGRPATFDDLTTVLGVPVDPRAITGATLGHFADADGATLLFAFLPDTKAYGSAGIVLTPTLVMPRSVTVE